MWKKNIKLLNVFLGPPTNFSFPTTSGHQVHIILVCQNFFWTLENSTLVSLPSMIRLITKMSDNFQYKKQTDTYNLL
jgi:hypothetical protein